MTASVALLRGINVGGNNLIPMADLRALFGALGFRDVATYIQSGNVVFRAETAPRVGDLESAIAERFGKRVSVVLRSGEELAAIVSANPFPSADLKRIQVFFLDEEPRAELDPNRSPGDTLVVKGREIWAHCPNGFGESKLTADWFERQLRTPRITARNWNTVTTLARMAG